MTGGGDTIAAVATAPGRGGVGIVRVSGSAVSAVAEALIERCPQPRYAAYVTFRDSTGTAIDQGIALYFPGPRSFTGEDVLELHGHGGPVVLDLLLAAVLRAGARPARPGEFSQRAFLNGKLDLAQAEAVADLIDSASAEAARAALRSLEGTFSRQVDALVEALIQLRTYVEAALDFPEEEIDFLAEGQVAARIDALREQLESLLHGAHQGQLLRDGMTVVLAGRPNAGKSSLLNALAGRETAIVTDIPGTTRDLLREQISLDGMPLHVIDTAGLRESADPIEQEGIRRAWAEIERADRVLLLVDDRDGVGADEQTLLARLPAGLPLTVVRNKIDLTGSAPWVRDGALGVEVALSALAGTGLDLLRRHLEQVMGFRSGGEGSFLARRRHIDALRRAAERLGEAADRVAVGQGEMAAEELRMTQQALAEITGEFGAEDLLERIFSSFCIGK